MPPRTGMYSKIVKLLSSSFGLGYMPFWPGAWGSLAGLAVAWLAQAALLPLTVAFSLLGLALCAPAEKLFGRKDPQVFVWDEVCGMMLSVLWIPAEWPLFAAAYLLFRLFDVWKPWPVSIFQKMKHPSGIMLDDLAAGVIANLCLQAYRALV